MSDPKPLDPNKPAGTPPPHTELPPWLRKTFVGLGVAGPFIGWLIGFMTAPTNASPVDLAREAAHAATGPFGATILAVLLLGGLLWHHTRTLSEHKRERKDKSASTARIAARFEAKIDGKDQKLEEASEKTLSVFKGTVVRYEKVLSEMSARMDLRDHQLAEMREDLKEIMNRITR